MKNTSKAIILLSAGLLFSACSQTDNPNDSSKEDVVEYKNFKVDVDIPTDSKQPYGSTTGSKALVDPQGDGEIKWEGIDYVTAVPDNSTNKYPLYIQTPSTYNDDMSQLIGMVEGKVTKQSAPNGLVSFYLYYPADTDASNDPVEINLNEDKQSVMSINYPKVTNFDIQTDVDPVTSHYESTLAFGKIQPLISGGVRDLLVSEDGLRSLEDDVNIDFYPFNVLTTLQIGTTGLSAEQIDKINTLQATMVVGSITAIDANGRMLEKGPFNEQLNLDPTRITTDNGIQLSDIHNFLEPNIINGLAYVENRIHYVDNAGNPRPTTYAERIVTQPGEAPTLYLPIFSSPVLDGVMSPGNDWLFKAEFYNGTEKVLEISKVVDGEGRTVWPVGTFNTVQMINDNNSTFDFGPFPLM